MAGLALALPLCASRSDQCLAAILSYDLSYVPMNHVRQPYRRGWARWLVAAVVAITAFGGLFSATSRPLRGMLAELLWIVAFMVPSWDGLNRVS